MLERDKWESMRSLGESSAFYKRPRLVMRPTFHIRLGGNTILGDISPVAQTLYRVPKGNTVEVWKLGIDM
jgi:hypothetical protein